jgi:hypothetical protein
VNIRRRALYLGSGVLLLCPGAAFAGHGKPPGKPEPPTATAPAPVKPSGGYAETHYGLTCTWSKTGGGSVSCGKTDGTGLVVAVSKKLAQVTGEDGSVLFSGPQPKHSRGKGRPPSAGVTFRHSQRGLVCEWRTANGGAVLCGTTDRRGYAVGVWSTVAVVIDATGKVVYIGKQP